MTNIDLSNMVTAEMKAATARVAYREAVDAERDRRIASGVVFNGDVFQTRPADRENIAGACTLALAAVVGGSPVGDLRWHGGADDFAWIAADNSLHTMDARTMLAFGAVVANAKERLVKAGFAIKELETMADDVADDALWP